MVVPIELTGSTFDELPDELSHLMDELMSGGTFRLFPSEGWEPNINIYEVTDRVFVCVELAGMSPDEIEVEVQAGTLRISGVRPKPQWPESAEEPSVHVMEIDSGRFHRRIGIPGPVESSKITATYRNGLLWVMLPRGAASRAQ